MTRTCMHGVKVNKESHCAACIALVEQDGEDATYDFVPNVEGKVQFKLHTPRDCIHGSLLTQECDECTEFEGRDLSNEEAILMFRVDEVEDSHGNNRYVDTGNFSATVWQDYTMMTDEEHMAFLKLVDDSMRSKRGS